MPEEDLKDLITENLQLTKENYRLLRSLRRQQRWHGISKIFYWLIIIGIALGSFVYLKPYIKNVENAYQDLLGQVEKVDNTKDSVQSGVQDILDAFGSLEN